MGKKKKTVNGRREKMKKGNTMAKEGKETLNKKEKGGE